MALTEEARHRLITRLESTVGPEEAYTLMEYLPPVGWADVATKRDLELVEARIRLEFTQQFGAFRDEMHADRRTAQRRLIFVLVVALVGLALAVAGVR